MKICMISTVHPLYDTRIFFREAKTLVNNGYDLSLIIQHDKKELIDGINVVPLSKTRSRLIRMTVLNIKALFKSIKENADVYHLHDPELIFVGLFLRMLGKKVVFDVHENIALDIETKQWVPFRKLTSKIYRLIEDLFFRYFYLILAEESYVKYYKDHPRKIIVQNFPDLTLFPEKKDIKENYMVYLGAISEDRGIFKMLELASHLTNNNLNTKLIIIGNVPEHLKEKINSYINSRKLQDKIKFTGRLKAPEAYEIVSKARLGLSILKPVKNYTESYPTKLFEYMALGVPFITSNFPLYNKLVNDTKAGYTVDYNNMKDIVEKVEYILLNEKLSKKMGENGRKAVLDRYNWDKEAEKLIKLYKYI